MSLKRNIYMGFRLNTVDRQMLTTLSKRTGISNSGVIRALIQMAYTDMSERKGRNVSPLFYADK